MARPLIPSELRAHPPVWLLTISIGGFAWRLATQAVELTDAVGEGYRYDGLLPLPQLQQALAFLGSDPGADGLSLRDLRLEGVLDRIDRGDDLSVAVGELALHLPGEAWEDRRIVLTGVLREPQYDAGDVVSFTIQAGAWQDRARIPLGTAVIDAVTWPDHREDHRSRAYPIVQGTPGAYDQADGTAATTIGSEALWVWNTDFTAARLLIAGHRVAAETVTIENLNDGTTESLAVEHVQDGRGAWVATVSLVTVTTLTRTLTHNFGVRWDNGGALRGTADSGAILGAGELLQWWLQQTSLGVDLARSRPAFQLLNAYKLSGVVEKALHPKDFIKGALQPVLPMSISTGPQGLYPVFWKHNATPADAVAELYVTPGLLEPAGPITFEGEPTPEFRLQYALAVDKGAHRRTLVLSGDPSRAGVAGVLTNSQVRSAWIRHEVRHRAVDPEAPVPPPPVKEVKSDFIYDERTAALVLTMHSFAEALPRRVLVYDISSELVWLQHGQWLVLNDKDRRITSQLAWVEGIGFNAGGLEHQLHLKIFDQPLRDRR